MADCPVANAHRWEVRAPTHPLPRSRIREIFFSSQDRFSGITNKPRNINHIKRIFRFIRFFETSHIRTICPPCMCVKGARIGQKSQNSAFHFTESSIWARCPAIIKAGHLTGHGFGIFDYNCPGTMYRCPKRTPTLLSDSRNARGKIYSRRKNNLSQIHPIRQPRT